MPRMGFIYMLLMHVYEGGGGCWPWWRGCMVDHSLYVEGIVLSSSPAGDWLAAVGSAHQSHSSGGKVTGDLFKKQLERGAGLVRHSA